MTDKQLIDKILHDPTYEGGVQYWIQKHDAQMLINARLIAALSDLSSTVGGYLHGAEWHHWKECHAARFAEALANKAVIPTSPE